ncbi:MAG: TonB-dependent receptor [Parvularculaceae bacterium]
MTLSAAALAQDEAPGDEIVVTGSRIARPELESVAPLMSVSADTIKFSGATNIESLLSEIPALGGSSGTFETNESGALTGVNFLNLRNLGTQRTLVLVNGRRHVGADATGVPAVDTNSIPTGLIERVEVLTGGVSAVYGADAVSGVVNFILKDDFEGISARSQYGISDRGDANEMFASVLGGKNFANGRGNATLGVEYRSNKALKLSQRSFGLSNPWFLVNNPAEYNSGVDDPNVPDQILAHDLHYVYTAPTGRYDVFGYDTVNGVDLEFGDVILNNQGLAYDEGTYVSGFTALGGDGTPVNYFDPEFFPKTWSFSANHTSHYDFSDKVRGFVELKYVRTKAINPGEPSFTSYLTLGLDNPFIPQAMQDVLATIDDPFVNLARDDLELRVVENNKRETYRAVAGIKGDLSDALSYELSFNYGRTDVESRLQGLRREDRYFAALDAVADPVSGDPVCRSSVDPSAEPPVDPVVSSYNPGAYPSTFTPGPNSGCVPFNPFISSIYTPGANAEALAWITGSGEDVIDYGRVTQMVVQGFVSGDSSGFGFELPAGPIAYVLGGEYRKEKTKNDVSALRNDPNALTFYGVEQDIEAQFDVYEFFTEMHAPIIEDGGLFMQSFSVDAAYRYSNYSTIGATNAYSFGGTWELVDSFRIRGSYGKSVRAPNLSELYSPANESFFGPVDPCDSTNADAQSANTLANCAIELNALGIDPSTFIPSSAVLRSGVITGNPDLSEEKGTTFTVGGIFQPSFLKGVTATIDYWNIRLEDAILQPSEDSVVEQCYLAPSLDNQFCDLFTRDSGGIIEDFISTPVNVGELRTKGIDFTFAYGAGLDDIFKGAPGDVLFRITGSRLLSLETQPSLAPLLVEEAGQVETLLGTNAPEWTLNLDAIWSVGRFAFNYGVNYESSLDIFTDAERAADPDISAFLKTKRYINHDVQISYDLNDNFQVYGGVNNIGDRLPDPTFFNTPSGPVGRYFYFGVEANF